MMVFIALISQVQIHTDRFVNPFVLENMYVVQIHEGKLFGCDECLSSLVDDLKTVLNAENIFVSSKKRSIVIDLHEGQQLDTLVLDSILRTYKVVEYDVLR